MNVGIRRVTLYLYLLIFISLISVASAFEDSFQYYPGDDYSANWVGYAFGYGANTPHIVTEGATYSRAIKLYYNRGGVVDPTGGGYVQLNITQPRPESNYYGFTVRAFWGSGGNYNYVPRVYLYFYNSTRYLLLKTGTLHEYPAGFWELLVENGQVYLRIDGVNYGSLGVCVDGISDILFEVNQPLQKQYYSQFTMILDDISTSGYIVGIGTASTYHFVSEAVPNVMNISWTANSYPITDFTNAEYKLNLIKINTGENIRNTIVKSAGSSTPFYGFDSFEWQNVVGLSNYGLYFSKLTMNGATKATDYFYFQRAGDTSYINFEKDSYVSGETANIDYFIDNVDFSTYSYYIKVYDSALTVVKNTQVYSATGTTTWDSVGSTEGIYYTTLTASSTSGSIDLAYDLTTITELLSVSGTTYDVQSGNPLGGVTVSMRQGITYFNTTSNATTGNYALSNFQTAITTHVNASKAGYHHEDFSFIPPIVKNYVLNIYLKPNSYTYNQSAILGIVRNTPFYQVVENANVSVSNATWNTTVQTSSSGFYMVDGLEDGSYAVSVTKSGHLNGTNNPRSNIIVASNFSQQNFALIPLYNLTVKAKDSVTNAYITSFSSSFAGTELSTTNGTIAFTNREFTYDVLCVYSTGYYSTCKLIYLDQDKEVIFDLVSISSATSNVITYSPLHAIRWIVLALNGTRYPGVNVTSTQAGNVSSAITGTDGSVVFWMNSTLYYDLTFIKTSQGINLTWSGYPYDGTYFIYTNGTIVFVPTAITNTTLTNYTIQYTNESWSLQNLTGTYLTSSMGLGPTAQGILVGTLSYVIVGAAGPVGIVLSMCILALLGIITWVMVLFVAMTILALCVLLGGVGSSW